jgi:6,7-dimethyl-8-ribityllumazine synthase
MRLFEGTLAGGGLKIAIVAGRFNHFIVDRLVEGAACGLRRTGVADDNVSLYHAPGSFEIPQVARRVLDAGGVDALIALGAVIRGATPHFDYVAGAVANGLADLTRSSKIPVLFGVLTTETIEQAIERAGTKAGNKGYDCALAAVEMATLYRSMSEAKR